MQSKTTSSSPDQSSHTNTVSTSSPSPNVESRPPNPLQNASFLARILHSWPYTILKRGRHHTLTEIDLPVLLPMDTSQQCLQLFTKIYDEEKQRSEKKNRPPSLHRAIFFYFLKTLWFIQPMYALISAGTIGTSIALGHLIDYFTNTAANSSDGYLWVLIMFLCSAFTLILRNFIFFQTWHLGMRFRAAGIASVYSKTLRLSSLSGASSIDKNNGSHDGSDESSSTMGQAGNITNLASNDVERFFLATIFISYLLWAPVEAIAVLIVGSYVMGPAFASGFALLLLFVPLQFFLSKRFAILRSQVAKITDERVTLLSQAIGGVRMLKMSAWEDCFALKIKEVREREMKRIQQANKLKALNEAVYYTTGMIVSVVIFLFHIVLFNGVLSTSSVFVVTSLVNIVQFSMAKFFSLGVMGVSECYVSITRIQKFLDQSEQSPVPSPPISSNPPASQITLTSVDAHWPNSTSALTDITLTFSPATITCIIGPVGAGKSALLQLLASELPPSSGTFLLPPDATVAYAPQDPWIMDGTVRDNIMFGLPFDDCKYARVLTQTALMTDLEKLVNGDNTIVGDRGVRLSGGQRARLALARALYRGTDILLLDDPLSAVDGRVGGIVWEGIMEEVEVRGVCVVLATHGVSYLNGKRCVLMKGGAVVDTGVYEEIVEKSGCDVGLVEDRKVVSDEQGDDWDDDENDSQAKSEKNITLNKKNEDAEDFKERSVEGIVQLSTWLAFGKAMGGWPTCMALLILFLITQCSLLLTIAALGKWSEVSAEEQNSRFYLILVSALALSTFILSIIRSLLTFYFAIRASQRLHDAMTTSVLHTNISFFDTNPLGRILNRFSADVGSNDDLLPATLFDFLSSSIMVLGAMVTAFVVMAFTLLALPPLGFLFLRYRRIFLMTSRELKRMEGMARSPIYAMISESLNGIATIRANGCTSHFQQMFENKHDTHTRAFFPFLATSRWLAFRMDGLMVILTNVSALLAVLFQERGWWSVDPAVLGLALSILMQLSGTFQWSVRQSAELVNHMVSVERVTMFSKLDKEAPLKRDFDNQIEKEWPTKGAIEIIDASVRYRPGLPLSLGGLSCPIDGGDRVGIVGRTGSGKSTLVQTLFRLLELETGQIFMDGVDISSLGLHKLRSQMSVIPQHPVLFAGCSVRYNLDPFNMYDDERVRNALLDVQMMGVIDRLDRGWNEIVAEGGSNFSAGQRQLLCLARAILRQSKILILDEPTANVDAQTDVLLQRAIQKRFRGCTILAVAHRLDTVVGYDKILVLGDGTLLEFGSPKELLSGRMSDRSMVCGAFEKMVDDCGAVMAQELRKKVFGGV